MFQPSLSGTTSTKTKPKIQEKRQKWSTEEYKKILHLFCYELENPSKTYTTKRTYKLRCKKKQNRERI